MPPSQTAQLGGSDTPIATAHQQQQQQQQRQVQLQVAISQSQRQVRVATISSSSMQKMPQNEALNFGKFTRSITIAPWAANSASSSDNLVLRLIVSLLFNKTTTADPGQNSYYHHNVE
ncbi:hypothetical protein ACLKA6_018213 [Drosophila palustris]